MEIIPLMAQSEFNALSELITRVTVSGIAGAFVLMVVGVIVIARIIMRPVNEMIRAMNTNINSIGENFREVLEASAAAAQRSDARVVKHEEAMKQFMELNARWAGVVDQVSSNVTGMASAIGGYKQTLDTMQQGMTSHEQHAADRSLDILKRIEEIDIASGITVKSINKKLDEAMGMMKKLGQEVRQSRLTPSQIDSLTTEFQRLQDQVIKLDATLRGVKRSTQEIQAVVAPDTLTEAGELPKASGQ